MARHEHVATRGGDGPPTFFVCLFFFFAVVGFFLTLILCLRSSCGNSCLTLNTVKSLSSSIPKGTPSRQSGERVQQLSAAADTTSPNTKEGSHYSVVIASEKCLHHFNTTRPTTASQVVMHNDLRRRERKGVTRPRAGGDS